MTLPPNGAPRWASSARGRTRLRVLAVQTGARTHQAISASSIGASLRCRRGWSVRIRVTDRPSLGVDEVARLNQGTARHHRRKQHLLFGAHSLDPEQALVGSRT